MLVDIADFRIHGAAKRKQMELVGYPNGKGYEKTAKLKLWNPKRPAN